MAGARPTFIDLGLPPSDSFSRPGLVSPRVQYNDGEIPPLLSPLDAFAAQSRMMAQRLDMEKVGEKRMSRLDPGVVTKSLSQHRADRPTVFRSLSGESNTSQTRDTEVSANPLTVERPNTRPVSQRTRVSGLRSGDSQETDGQADSNILMEQVVTSPIERQPATQPDYFALPRSKSPVPTAGWTNSMTAPIQSDPLLHSTLPSSTSSQPTPLQQGSSNTQFDSIATLPPPIRSVPHHESSDDEYNGSMTGSSFSCSRKLSASSGISAPHSPLSPFLAVRPNRSPSITSEASVNGISAPRAALNFSRPRSTASPSLLGRGDPLTPHQPTNTRHAEPSTPAQRSWCASPQPEEGEALDTDGELGGARPSYTYTKYCLPRGRAVSRDSKIFHALSTPHFEWQKPFFQDTSSSTVASDTAQRPPGSPARLRLEPNPDDHGSPEKNLASHRKPTRPATPDQSIKVQQSASPSQSLKSTKSAVSSKTGRSVEVSDVRSTCVPSTTMGEADDMKSVSSASASTVRPISGTIGNVGPTGHRYVTAEDHVRKAIECHENGSLNESTYHLRIAAMQNHPTAMLLYALACRHGWGMRPNPREGVQWLRKALDSASLEMAENENFTSTLGPREIQDQQTKRAQFALSLYELGVSHLNGWGIEQDRALALRCFEMAGQWGDVDALTEAGFCYTEGVGCKKDLKKAAKFYRTAERRGASMVGNSWIYKDKYKGKDKDEETTRSRAPAQITKTSPPEKKTRSKSRTRGLFARKKSYQPA